MLLLPGMTQTYVWLDDAQARRPERRPCTLSVSSMFFPEIPQTCRVQLLLFQGKVTLPHNSIIHLSLFSCVTEEEPIGPEDHTTQYLTRLQRHMLIKLLGYHMAVRHPAGCARASEANNASLRKPGALVWQPMQSRPSLTVAAIASVL